MPPSWGTALRARSCRASTVWPLGPTNNPSSSPSIDAWRIRELTFDPAYAARNETIFSLGNGHLGLRGNLEEEAGNVAHGTYVNGFFEVAPIAYGEVAYGYAKRTWGFVFAP